MINRTDGANIRRLNHAISCDSGENVYSCYDLPSIVRKKASIACSLTPVIVDDQH